MAEALVGSVSVLRDAGVLWGGIGIDAALRGTVLLVVAGAVTLALGRAPAALRHLVWSLAVAGLLVTPLLKPALPSWRLALPLEPGWLEGMAGVAGAGSSVQLGTDGAAVRDPGQIVPREGGGPRDGVGSATSAADGGATGSADTGGLTSPVALTRHAQQAPAFRLGKDSAAAISVVHGGEDVNSRATVISPDLPASPVRPALWVLGIAWLAGTLALLCRLGISAARVRTAARHARTLDDGRAAEVAGELVRRLGLRRPVRLLVGGVGDVPMTWGLRPVVLLPSSHAAWSEGRLRRVLTHELAHVRRRDYLTQLLGEVAVALYWFHPLVWLATWRLRVERELACDDAVVRSGALPSAYAADLLEIARSARSTRIAALAVGMARSTELHGRLRALLDGRRRRDGVRTPAGAAAGAAGAALVLAMAAAAPGSSAWPAGLTGDAPAASAEAPGLPAERAPGFAAALPSGAPVDTAEAGPGGADAVSSGGSPDSSTPLEGPEALDPGKAVGMPGPAPPDLGRPAPPLYRERVTSVVAPEIPPVGGRLSLQEARHLPGAVGQDAPIPDEPDCWQRVPGTRMDRRDIGESLVHIGQSQRGRQFVFFRTTRCAVEIRLEGEVGFTADFHGLAWMAPRSSVLVREDGPSGELLLVARPGSDSRPLIEWKVNGRTRDFDAGAELWLARHLVALFRQTGVAGRERAAWILERQGPEGLAEETARFRATDATVPYMRVLAEQLAGRAERGELGEPEVVGLLLQLATSTVIYTPPVLAAIARRFSLEGEMGRAFFRLVRRAPSDAAEGLLIELASRHRLTGELGDLFFETVQRLQPDRAGAVLATVLTDEESLAIHSPADSILPRAVRVFRLRPVNFSARMQRVLAAVVVRDDLTAEEIDLVLGVVRETRFSPVRRNGDAPSEILVEIVRRHGAHLEGPLRDAYLDAAEAMPTREDYARAVNALLGREEPGS